MKAFILAAGLGTRLYPFTTNRPKALVELKGMTLLERAIRKVNELDVSEIVVNVHHFGSQIIDFLKEKENFHLPVVVSDERDQLLDTGGALLKAHALLGDREPFLVYNVDILSTIDLKDLMLFHLRKGGIATMAIRERITQRYLVFNSEMQLSGWRNVKTGDENIIRNEQILQNFAFSGIQIVQPEIFPLITETGKFSIIQLYLRLAQSQNIFGYHDQSDLWIDLGKPEQLIAAEEIIGKLENE